MPSSYATATPKPINRRANKTRARAMENREAQKLTAAGMPAKRVPLSGALKGVGLDGDVDAAWFLTECKSYTPMETPGGRYVRFDLNWLDKIEEEAKLSGKPGLVVMQPKGAADAFVVVRRNVFYALMGRAYQAQHGEPA